MTDRGGNLEGTNGGNGRKHDDLRREPLAGFVSSKLMKLAMEIVRVSRGDTVGNDHA